ncbi:MAG: MOSC domain-containing protein [Gammaproteobacteria bacterium]
MMPPTLNRILIYPVKSLAGIDVSRWPVGSGGFLYDRKWMVVDSDGQFLSQRKLAKMALINTALTDTALVLSAPAMKNLALPLTPREEAADLIPCTIWKDQSRAIPVSAEADRWLSHFLQQDCRLVYQPDREIRRVDPRYGLETDRVAYSDGFPFLIISENSLTSLNEDMGLELPMSRFRPNLVIAGCPAYAEDGWREIGIGSIGFRLPKPCSRCVVPTIDQGTGETGKEPLSTLNRLRKWQNKVYFGQNALHDGHGELRIGDTVKIIRTGPRQPPI